MLEALRHGKALVTTSIGAQGLPAGGGRAYRVADDAETFAQMVTLLLRDRVAARLPTWDDAAPALVSAYESSLSSAPAASSSGGHITR